MESKTTIKKKRPGFLVVTKDGRKGRTYHDVKDVNGKMVVYLEIDGKEGEYESRGILCDPLTLSQQGFID